jgi:predicted phage tail protein
MLRRIKLYGKLAKFIGHRVLEADVSSAAEAVRFLLANWPELEQHMADQHYRVSVGTYALDKDELHDPAGQQEISIAPVVAGAGTVGRIILGAVLIGLSFISGLQAAAIFGSKLTVGAALLSLGGGLVLGGVAQLLTPTPKMQAVDQDPRKTYNFSGIQQTSRQGTPVPVVYGKTLLGSIVISAGVDTVQVKA